MSSRRDKHDQTQEREWFYQGLLSCKAISFLFSKSEPYKHMKKWNISIWGSNLYWSWDCSGNFSCFTTVLYQSGHKSNSFWSSKSPQRTKLNFYISGREMLGFGQSRVCFLRCMCFMVIIRCRKGVWNGNCWAFVFVSVFVWILPHYVY